MEKINHSSYSYVILDDDLASVELLTQQLMQLPQMRLISQFTNPIDATHAFNSYETVDFLFLDIGMEVSGIDVARMLKNKAKFIVFVTGYSEFALEAFEYGDAYLVKPVDLKTLKRAILYLLDKSAKQVFENQQNLVDER
ncbi:LytR/AlgR family response regulator transcription factor [Pedobacter sp.]|uniref:LytR/AlgR family response regulator transcription factor n=1 Tax=Pedobacter sp. TaxID=1411316 RepID=UPI003BAB5777